MTGLHFPSWAWAILIGIVGGIGSIIYVAHRKPTNRELLEQILDEVRELREKIQDRKN